MNAKECYHCHRLIPEAERASHDCWTTTPENLIQDLDEDLKDAWERLHETALEFGEQRVYASHKSIMFARKHCYFFVRPKRSVLEVVFFVGRDVRDSRIKASHAVSRAKTSHLVQVTHRDEVESPLTDWLREAYDYTQTATRAPATERKIKPAAKTKKKRAFSPAKKRRAKKAPARKKARRPK